jgi:hypothetical protein
VSAVVITPGPMSSGIRLALVTVVFVQLVVFVAASLTQHLWLVPTLPVWLSVIVVSEYVPPLPSQSDFALACAEGAPTVINAPNPMAAAARAAGTNFVRAIVVMDQWSWPGDGFVIARKPEFRSQMGRASCPRGKPPRGGQCVTQSAD